MHNTTGYSNSYIFEILRALLFDKEFTAEFKNTDSTVITSAIFCEHIALADILLFKIKANSLHVKYTVEQDTPQLNGIAQTVTNYHIKKTNENMYALNLKFAYPCTSQKIENTFTQYLRALQTHMHALSAGKESGAHE